MVEDDEDANGESAAAANSGTQSKRKQPKLVMEIKKKELDGFLENTHRSLYESLRLERACVHRRIYRNKEKHMRFLQKHRECTSDAERAKCVQELTSRPEELGPVSYTHLTLPTICSV